LHRAADYPDSRASFSGSYSTCERAAVWDYGLGSVWHDLLEGLPIVRGEPRISGLFIWRGSRRSDKGLSGPARSFIKRRVAQ